MQQYDCSGFDELIFHVDCSIRYHSRRRRFYENVQQMALFVGFMFASGSFVSILNQLSDSWLSYGLPLLGASFVGIVLVGRPGAKANDHNDLKRRFIDLQCKMEMNRSNVTNVCVANWRAERLAIEADEPPVNRVAHALCYNELVRSKPDENFPSGKRRFVVVKLRHRLFGWATRLFDDGLELGKPVKRY